MIFLKDYKRKESGYTFGCKDENNEKTGNNNYEWFSEKINNVF